MLWLVTRIFSTTNCKNTLIHNIKAQQNRLPPIYDKDILKYPRKKAKCMIVIDEVYVKPSLRYSEREQFERAENISKELVNTALVVMIKCMFEVPNTLLKMIQISKLRSVFPSETVSTQSTIIGAVRGAHSQLWGTIIPVCSLYAARKYDRRFGTPTIVWFTRWN